MGKNLVFPWLFQKIRLFLSYQNHKTMNSNSVRIVSSAYPNGMTQEQWEAHSFGIELTGYADINPNTSVYPNGMTQQQWDEYMSDKNNFNRCFNRIGYYLTLMHRTAN